jgi:aprataxin
MAALKKNHYEPLLKEDLSCWKCGSGFKNIPQLKAHLQEEWDKQTKAEKAKLDRKRKREEKPGSSVAEPDLKRREIEE